MSAARPSLFLVLFLPRFHSLSLSLSLSPERGKKREELGESWRGSSSEGDTDLKGEKVEEGVRASQTHTSRRL
jgi:hypothetical protein